MKLLIHAGTHKTGTTYLQHFFALNERELLERHGILYPKAGRHEFHPYHHPFFAALIKRESHADEILSALEREVADAKPDLVLMSSEYLSRDSLTQENLGTLRSALRSDPIFLFYLRSQDEFALSRYAERIKQGILGYPQSIWDCTELLDYQKFLGRFELVFGRDSIVVRSFADARRSGLVDDFASAIRKPGIAKLSKPDTGANQRYCWLHLALLRHANPHPTLRRLLTHRHVTRFMRQGAAPAVYFRQASAFERGRSSTVDVAMRAQ